MLSYTKYRITKYFWLGVIAVSTSVGLSCRAVWWVIAPMFCVAVAASYEYGVTCESWRYKDIADYLKKHGFE